MDWSRAVGDVPNVTVPTSAVPVLHTTMTDVDDIDCRYGPAFNEFDCKTRDVSGVALTESAMDRDCDALEVASRDD